MYSVTNVISRRD